MNRIAPVCLFHWTPPTEVPGLPTALQEAINFFAGMSVEANAMMTALQSAALVKC